MVNTLSSSVTVVAEAKEVNNDVSGVGEDRKTAAEKSTATARRIKNRRGDPLLWASACGSISRLGLGGADNQQL